MAVLTHAHNMPEPLILILILDLHGLSTVQLEHGIAGPGGETHQRHYSRAANPERWLKGNFAILKPFIWVLYFLMSRTQCAFRESTVIPYPAM